MSRAWSILTSGVLALAASAVLAGQARADATREQRLAEAISRCRSAVEAGEQQAVHWCDQASASLMFARLDARKAEVLLLARWVTTAEGRSFGSAVSTRKAATRMPDPRLAEARSLTFDAVAMQQGFADGWDGRAMARLASIVGQESGTGGLIEQRLALLRAIRAGQPDEATFWAAAVLAVTWRLERPDVEVTREQGKAYIEEMIGLLGPLLAESRQLDGQARILHPVIALALVDLLSANGDYEAAIQTGDEAVLVCRERLWNTSSPCLDLGLASAMARERRRILARRPDLVGSRRRAPVVVKGSLHQRSYATDGRPCRVVVRFDLDAAGAVINAQVIHSEPFGQCDALALQAISGLVYESEASAPPGTSRTDLLQSIVIRPE